jgi:uroporphyrin-III C-methyltransferase
MKKEVTQHFGQVILHDLPPEPPLVPSAGSCTLVGAGPGDPNWLTAHAVQAIEAATVLVVEELVSDAVVALASPRCRVVRVDRRSGCPSMPQAVIDKLILHAVLEGHQVVRLKGGNPFNFSCVEQDTGRIPNADQLNQNQSS